MQNKTINVCVIKLLLIFVWLDSLIAKTIAIIILPCFRIYLKALI